MVTLDPKKRKPSGELHSPKGRRKLDKFDRARALLARTATLNVEDEDENETEGADKMASASGHPDAVVVDGMVKAGGTEFTAAKMGQGLTEAEMQIFAQARNGMPKELRDVYDKAFAGSQAFVASQAASRLAVFREKKKAILQMNECETAMEDFDKLDPEAKIQRLCDAHKSLIQVVKTESEARKRAEIALQKEIADAKRQYSKYGFKLIGTAIPVFARDEDTTDVMCDLIRRKYGIDVVKTEVRTCHRLRPLMMGGQTKEQIVVMATTTIRGSSFDKVLFRPNNWNGEMAGGRGIDLEISRLTARGADAKTKSILLAIRRNDKAAGKGEGARVKKVDVGSDGSPVYWPGRGKKRSVYHPQEAMALMTPQEMAEWAARAKKPRTDRDGETDQMDAE